MNDNMRRRNANYNAVYTNEYIKHHKHHVDGVSIIKINDDIVWSGYVIDIDPSRKKRRSFHKIKMTTLADQETSNRHLDQNEFHKEFGDKMYEVTRYVTDKALLSSDIAVKEDAIWHISSKYLIGIIDYDMTEVSKSYRGRMLSSFTLPDKINKDVYNGEVVELVFVKDGHNTQEITIVPFHKHEHFVIESEDRVWSNDVMTVSANYASFIRIKGVAYTVSEITKKYDLESMNPEYNMVMHIPNTHYDNDNNVVYDTFINYVKKKE